VTGRPATASRPDARMQACWLELDLDRAKAGRHFELHHQIDSELTCIPSIGNQRIRRLLSLLDQPSH